MGECIETKEKVKKIRSCCNWRGEINPGAVLKYLQEGAFILPRLAAQLGLGLKSLRSSANHTSIKAGKDL